MWAHELAERQAKVDKKIAKVKAKLKQVDDQRKSRGTSPGEWWNLTDLLEDLLDDLYALLSKRALLDGL